MFVVMPSARRGVAGASLTSGRRAVAIARRQGSRHSCRLPSHSAPPSLQAVRAAAAAVRSNRKCSRGQARGRRNGQSAAALQACVSPQLAVLGAGSAVRAGQPATKPRTKMSRGVFTSMRMIARKREAPRLIQCGLVGGHQLSLLVSAIARMYGRKCTKDLASVGP